MHPPKKGQRVRSQFRRGSIIVSYHLKTMCGNFHACIMILQLMPFPVPRTSQVIQIIFSNRNKASNRVVDLADPHDSMINPTIIAEHRPPEVIISQAPQVQHRYLRSLQNNTVQHPKIFLNVNILF